MPRLATLVLLAAAGLGACSSAVTLVGENTIVDGWSIGPEASCTVQPACDELIEAATSALDVRDPGHPAVVAATHREEGLYPNEDGDFGQLFRSGASGFSGIVLFLLADGTYRALGVGRLPFHPDHAPLTFEHGPGSRPGHTNENPEPAPTI